MGEAEPPVLGSLQCQPHPTALPELYPVTSLAKRDQKALSRTNDIPITQETLQLVALSKEQDEDQIHFIFIENVTMSLIFFLTFGL